MRTSTAIDSAQEDETAFRVRLGELCIIDFPFQNKPVILLTKRKPLPRRVFISPAKLYPLRNIRKLNLFRRGGQWFRYGLKRLYRTALRRSGDRE